MGFKKLSSEELSFISGGEAPNNYGFCVAIGVVKPGINGYVIFLGNQVDGFVGPRASVTSGNPNASGPTNGGNTPFKFTSACPKLF